MKNKKKESKKIIDYVIKQLDEKYPNSFISMRDEKKFKIDIIKTGASNLDRATGIGGIPTKKIIECYGLESVGKSTLALHIVSEFQKKQKSNGSCKIALYVDAEHCLDIGYARKLGVNDRHLILTQNSCTEDVYNIVEKLVKTGEIGLIVIDSIAALAPRAELEGDFDDQTFMLQARLNSRFMRNITDLLWDTNCALIIINQLRDSLYGKPKPPGGRAIKFYATLRIELKKIADIISGDKVTGSKITATIVKNKLAAPYKKAELDIIFGEGISKEAALIEECLSQGLIKKSGAWFIIPAMGGDEEKIQGRENLRIRLKEDDELKNKLNQRLNNGMEK